MSNIPEMPDYESIEQFTNTMEHLKNDTTCFIHNANALFTNKENDITNLSSIIENLGDQGYDEKHLDGGFTGDSIKNYSIETNSPSLSFPHEVLRIVGNNEQTHFLLIGHNRSDSRVGISTTSDFSTFSGYSDDIYSAPGDIISTYSQVIGNNIYIMALAALTDGNGIGLTNFEGIYSISHSIYNADKIKIAISSAGSSAGSFVIYNLTSTGLTKYTVGFTKTGNNTQLYLKQDNTSILLDTFYDTIYRSVVCAKIIGNNIYILFYKNGYYENSTTYQGATLYKACYSLNQLRRKDSFENTFIHKVFDYNSTPIFTLGSFPGQIQISDTTNGPYLMRLFSSLRIHDIKGHIVYTIGDQIKNFFDDSVVYSASSYTPYTNLTDIPLCYGFLFTDDKVYACKSSGSVQIAYPTNSTWKTGLTFTGPTPTSDMLPQKSASVMTIDANGDLICLYPSSIGKVVKICPIYKDLMVQRQFLPVNCKAYDWTGNIVTGMNTFHDFRSWDVFKTDTMNNVRSCVYIEKNNIGYFVCTTASNTMFHIKVTADAKPILETYSEVSGVTKSNVTLYKFGENIYFTDGTNAYLVNPAARAYQKSTTTTILPSSAARGYFTSAKNTYSRRYRYKSETEHYIIERNETTTQTKIYKFTGATPSAWVLSSTYTINGMDNGDMHYKNGIYMFTGKIDSSGVWQGASTSSFPSTSTVNSLPTGSNSVLDRDLINRHQCYIRDSFDNNFTKVISTGGVASLDVKNYLHPTNNLVTEVDWLATLTDSNTNVTAYYVFNLDMNWGSYLSYCIESPVMYRIHSGSFIMSENNYNNDECQLIFPYYQTTDYATQPHHCFYAVEMRDSDLTLNFRLTCSNLYQIGEEENSLLKWFDCSNIAIVRKDNTINAQVFTASVNNISDKISCFFNNRTWSTLSNITNGDFNGKVFDWYLITIAH